MTDIERLKEIAQEKNAQWLGLSNIKAINNVIAELEKYKRVVEELLDKEVASVYDEIDDVMRIVKDSNYEDLICLVEACCDDIMATRIKIENLLGIDEGDD